MRGFKNTVFPFIFYEDLNFSRSSTELFYLNSFLFCWSGPVLPIEKHIFLSAGMLQPLICWPVRKIYLKFAGLDRHVGRDGYRPVQNSNLCTCSIWAMNTKNCIANFVKHKHLCHISSKSINSYDHYRVTHRQTKKFLSPV